MRFSPVELFYPGAAHSTDNLVVYVRQRTCYTVVVPFIVSSTSLRGTWPVPIWLNGPPPLSGFKNTTPEAEVVSFPGTVYRAVWSCSSTQRTLSKHTKIAQSPSSRCGITNRWSRTLPQAAPTPQKPLNSGVRHHKVQHRDQQQRFRHTAPHD